MSRKIEPVTLSVDFLTRHHYVVVTLPSEMEVEHELATWIMGEWYITHGMFTTLDCAVNTVMLGDQHRKRQKVVRSAFVVDSLDGTVWGPSDCVKMYRSKAA